MGIPNSAPHDSTYVAGTQGTLRSFGPSVNRQMVELTRAGGTYRPELLGSWFPDGFHGTMGELLCAIEERREPSHSARGTCGAWSCASRQSPAR